MTIKIIAFGIAADILKTRELEITVADGTTVAVVKRKLEQEFPDFQKLAKFSLAVGEEYRADDFVIPAHQEVVIIPPVAGG